MKRKKLIKVDFTGVSTEGGGRLIDEGPQQFEVKDITEEEGKESGEPYLAFTLEVVDGDFKGSKAWDNFSLQPQSLWKLRGFMEAGGHATEDGPMEIDPDDLIGTVVIGHVIHEDFRGKTKHRIDSYSPVDGGDAPAADEAPPSRAAKKRPAASEPDAPEWKKGDEVKFKDGKKYVKGVIAKINGENVDVKVGREEYEMTLSDLEAA